MSGFKDIIKKEHIEALARRQAGVEDALGGKFNAIGKAMNALHEEHEFLYQAVLNPWPARWKNIMAWLGKK